MLASSVPDSSLIDTDLDTETTVVAASSPAGVSKKLWLIIGLVVLVLAAVAGGLFFFKDQVFTVNNNQPVTLKYWGLWESPDSLKEAAAAYKKLHPNVTIQYEQRPIDQHYETTKSRLSRSGADVPDIVRVHSSWVPILANLMAPMPAEVMTTAQFESTFYGVNKDMLSDGSAYYALPLEIDGLSLIYNQDLFAKAGITQVPTTWDEVRQAAGKITEKDKSGRILTAGIAMGTAGNVDNFADIVGLLMAQNGVTFTDSKGNLAFDKSLSADGRNLGAEALTFYTMFATGSTKYWDDTLEYSTVAFSKGKVGMILAPSWRILSVLSQNPQLRFKVAPAPHLTTDQKIGYASYWVEAVAKNSPHSRQAWQFLKFLSEREQQIGLVSEQQKSHAFGEPFSRVDLADTLTTDPLLGPYIQQAPDYRTSFFTNDARGAFSDGVRNGLADVVQKTLTVGNNRDAAAAAALTDLQAKMTALIAEQR